MNFSLSQWPFPRITRLILAIATAAYAIHSGKSWIFIITGVLLWLVIINFGCPFTGRNTSQTTGAAPFTQEFKKYKP